MKNLIITVLIFLTITIILNSLMYKGAEKQFRYIKEFKNTNTRLYDSIEQAK